MKNTFIIIMILISGVITAQECKIDLHSLAQPDINMIQLNKFGQSRLYKIVLTDGFDTIANKDIITQLSQWFINQDSKITIVNVNDVNKLEDNCHYLIIGLTSKLKDLLFQHPERITSDCKLIQNNLEIIDLITGKTDFWKGPYKNGQCLSYPISGLFVKFLIDKYGIDSLRELPSVSCLALSCI